MSTILDTSLKNAGNVESQVILSTGAQILNETS